MRRQVLAQRVVVVDGGGYVVQDCPVGASHQDADFSDAGEFVGHGGEAGHKEIAHGNIGRPGLSEDGLEILGEGGNAGGVDDVHIRPLAGQSRKALRPG